MASDSSDNRGSVDPDLIEDEVMSWLPDQQAGKLEEVCAHLDLTCSTEIQGKKKPLLRFVMKHIIELGDEYGSQPITQTNHQTLQKVNWS